MPQWPQRDVVPAIGGQLLLIECEGPVGSSSPSVQVFGQSAVAAGGHQARASRRAGPNSRRLNSADVRGRLDKAAPFGRNVPSPPGRVPGGLRADDRSAGWSALPVRFTARHLVPC